MLADLHFLTPAWLLALVPLAVLLLAAARQGAAGNAWQQVVDRHLLPHLLLEPGRAVRWLPLGLLATGWLLAVIALANPTYERRPTPAIRPADARVVILDLSASMDASDLKPSRLARARYKVADILNRSRDGQVGLVAFAGDAFVVAPLSDDVETLRAMLDALTPDVMPVRGSRPDLALRKAAELLSQGGASGGEVILVGDDGGDDRALAAARALLAQGRTLSVLGVGTPEGAPVPGVRDAAGKPVLARLDEASLRRLARAGGGDYAALTPDSADLDLVLRRQPGHLDQTREAPKVEADQWEGLGPWIALALLPLAALGFRRGWLMGMGMSLILLQGGLSPSPALALTWDDLWQRPDQQAAAALAQGDHQRALGLAQRPDQRGAASYRLGDYQAAAEAFGAAGGAEGQYNRGNALALAGKLEEALAAYDEALKTQPGMEDAAYNKARVEELLRQRQQQQQQQQQGQQGQQGQQDSGPGGSQASAAGGASNQAPHASEPSQPRGDQAAGTQAPGGQGGAESGPQPQSSAGDQPARSEAGQAAGAGQDQGADGGSQDGAQADTQQGAQQESPQPSAERRQAQGQQGLASGSPAAGEDAPEARDADARRAQAEAAAADYSAEAKRQAPGASGGEDAAPRQAGATAEADLSPRDWEARQATDQWLRRIPDDPSGLLRRKFLYQYRQRNPQGGVTTSGNPW